jgi:hypothetical protein
MTTLQAPSIDRLHGDHDSQIAVHLGQERWRYLATELLNQLGDVNLGIHDLVEFPFLVSLQETQERGRIRDALIEPKYFPSGHCTARPMMDIPHRDRSKSTPSDTAAFASRVRR